MYDPRFIAALEELERLKAAGEERSPRTLALWRQVFDHAPPLFRQAAREVMAEILPRPVGLDAAGRPLYRLADVAENAGIDPRELEAAAQAAGLERAVIALRAQ